MRAKSIQQLLKLNQLLINAEPVVKVNDGVIHLDFFYSGRAYVKPVYLDECASLLKRVGEVLYISYPRSRSEDDILKSLFARCSQRKRVSIIYNRLYTERKYPIKPKTGSLDEGFVYYKGTKYKAERLLSFQNRVVIEDDNFYVCCKNRTGTRKVYERWLLEETRNHLNASYQRIKENYALDDINIKIYPRKSSMIGIKTCREENLVNFPVGFIVLPDKELDVVMLYVLLRHKIERVDDIGDIYPYLYELTQYIIKHWGFHTESTRQICAQFRCFSDTALANIGKRMYPFMELIMQGRPKHLERQIKAMLA